MTDISQPQRGTRQRVLHLDHEPYRVTSIDAVRALDLRIGLVIDPAELDRRLDAAEPALVRQRALRLLGYRDRPAADLRTRLIADGYPAGLAADVVADLSHVRVVDDERYAENAARSLTGRRVLGRSRAVREIVAAGVDESAAAEAVDAALTPDAEEEAARALARALAARPGMKVQHITARLARRGYPLGLANRVAREAVADARDDDTLPDLPVSDT